MKASILCYSLKGKETARKIADLITKEYGAEVECFAPEKSHVLTSCIQKKRGGGVPRPCEKLKG